MKMLVDYYGKFKIGQKVFWEYGSVNSRRITKDIDVIPATIKRISVCDRSTKRVTITIELNIYKGLSKNKAIRVVTYKNLWRLQPIE